MRPLSGWLIGIWLLITASCSVLLVALALMHRQGFEAGFHGRHRLARCRRRLLRRRCVLACRHRRCRFPAPRQCRIKPYINVTPIASSTVRRRVIICPGTAPLLLLCYEFKPFSLRPMFTGVERALVINSCVHNRTCDPCRASDRAARRWAHCSSPRSGPRTRHRLPFAPPLHHSLASPGCRAAACALLHRGTSRQRQRVHRGKRMSATRRHPSRHPANIASYTMLLEHRKAIARFGVNEGRAYQYWPPCVWSCRPRLRPARSWHHPAAPA